MGLWGLVVVVVVVVCCSLRLLRLLCLLARELEEGFGDACWFLLLVVGLVALIVPFGCYCWWLLLL